MDIHKFLNLFSTITNAVNDLIRIKTFLTVELKIIDISVNVF